MSSKNQELKNNFFLDYLLPSSILVLITTLFYWPYLKYPFQFDDLANISKKFTIRCDNALSRWSWHSRWMADWLNGLNFKIARFEPFYYRTFNLILHIFTGLLIFYLIKHLCDLSKPESFLKKNSFLISFCTSIIFLLHPVQTQAVSYVIQARLEGLASFFVIAILLTFVKALTVKNNFLKYFLLFLSFLLMGLSWGTKEVVVVTPFLLLLVDWFFISKNSWDNFKKRAYIYLVFLLVFIILAVNYVDLNHVKNIFTFQATSTNNRGNILTDNAFDTITAWQFFISEFKVLLHYIFMFFWPFSICVEYDWKLSQSFFSPEVFFSFFALVIILFSAFYLLIKKNNIYYSFGLFWFFITMAPRTTFYPCPELVCDYKTYLASIGIIFILGVLLTYLVKFIYGFIEKSLTNLSSYNLQLIVVIVLMVPVGFSTLVRNKVWASASNFWCDIVEKAPLKARGHNNFGVALAEENKVDQAIEQYKIAINLDKYYADPWSNLGVAYSVKGDVDQGIAAFKGALNINPNYPEAYNNIGTLFLKKKDYDNAVKALEYALQLRPWYGKAFYNLGRLYMEKNEMEKAWVYFDKATKGDLDTPEGFFTLGQVSMRLRKFEEAVNAFQEILKRNFCNPQILFNLGNAYFMLEKHEQALNIYKKLVQENPLDARYLYNLAETFYMKKEYEQALVLFKKVLSLPEPLPNAHFRIASCFEMLKQMDQAKGYLNNLLTLNAPDDFKLIVNKELARLNLQDKLDKNNGALKLSDIKNNLRQVLNSANKKS